MAKRVCKFFAHGACLKGNHCEFVHDWRARSNHICNFYQKGLCTYGSRCKYEHVKVTHSPSAPRSSLEDISNSLPIQPPSVAAVSTADFAPIISTEQSPSIGGDGNSDHHDLLDDDDNLSHSMCSLAAEGDCLRGENCPDIHGEPCPICNKECLHPFRPQEREEHLRSCEERQKHLEALKRSEEIECNVCLERVFSKPTPAERRFGILPECDHPFCISCIRNWRSNSSFGIDINSALRACPTCRTRSYYVVPSSVWYFSKEEKQDIVQSYKGKLRSIDCKHFDFGNGICPFGTSCFYRHSYRDGNRNLQQPANYDIFWLSNILDNLHLG